jgi:two-component system, chemotaxis family, CheB/CheR fusion protein
MTAGPEQPGSAADGSGTDAQDLERLLAYLKQCRGFDFTGYRRPSLSRRIGHRMQTLGVESYGAYIECLAADPAEFDALFNTILINVTGFFRDPSAWDRLASPALEGMLDRRAPGGGDPIRIWSVGCASGEEAYTLAIVLAELLGEDDFRARVKIYAADIDDDALAIARLGSYAAKDVSSIAPPLIDKYFERSDDRFVFRRDLRRALIFGRHDLIRDPPISRIDLLVCRNVLMYFNADVQKRILMKFHFALVDSGLLFLGRAETLLTHSSAFAPVDAKQRIFANIARAQGRDRLLMLDQVEGGGPRRGALQGEEERLGLAAFDSGPVARIVTDRRGQLAQINEQARALFGLAASDVGRPLQDLEVSYRPVELRSCIEQAFSERRAVHLRAVEWPSSVGEGRWFDVIVDPLFASSRKALGASVSFFDVSRNRELQVALEQANDELEGAYEALQSTNEELETTNEELQSTIEELETTNEELQSTNEELETTNDELHATNHRLQTINSDLGISRATHDDANTVLESVVEDLAAALVVVDREFRVAVWNARAVDLWGLRGAEAIGEHFLRLDIGLPVAELRAPLRALLTGEGDLPEIVLHATNRRGRPMLVRVGCRALRLGRDSRRSIDGVIMVMEEIVS